MTSRFLVKPKAEWRGVLLCPYYEAVNRKEISEFMRQMGRKGGKKGGKRGGRARMAHLSPEQRSEFARKGAIARWKKAKERSGKS